VGGRTFEGGVLAGHYGITLGLELPMKWADWMRSKFNIIH